jgi:hypothetical protein
VCEQEALTESKITSQVRTIRALIEAERAARIGIGEAIAIENKVRTLSS